MDTIDQLDGDAMALINSPKNLTMEELQAIGKRIGRLVIWLKEPV